MWRRSDDSGVFVFDFVWMDWWVRIFQFRVFLGLSSGGPFDVPVWAFEVIAESFCEGCEADLGMEVLTFLA